MVNFLYLFITLMTINYISTGDTSIDWYSLNLINQRNFDEEFNDVLKAKLYSTHLSRPLIARNSLNVLHLNLDKEKIDLSNLNKKLSRTTFFSLCLMNGIAYIYAQIYGDTRDIFCDQKDKNCFNAGFSIKNSAYQEYIYAIIVPWVLINFITLGGCIFVFNQKAKGIIKHNKSIEQKKWEVSSFLNSLQSGTYTPATQV